MSIKKVQLVWIVCDCLKIQKDGRGFQRIQSLKFSQQVEIGKLQKYLTFYMYRGEMLKEEKDGGKAKKAISAHARNLPWFPH